MPSAKARSNGATPSRRTVTAQPKAAPTAKGKGKAAAEAQNSARSSGSRRAAAAKSYAEDSDGDDDDEDDASGDEYAEAEEDSPEVEEEDDDESDYDSDDLDGNSKNHKSKSKRSNGAGSSRTNATAKAGSKRKSGKDGKSDRQAKKQKTEGDDIDYSQDDEEDSDSDVSLASGQEIAGRIIPAPKTGHVPAGEISRNTFKFLVNLQDPEKNDREWFKLHEPAFRLAEKEWLAFVTKMIPEFRKVDAELPMLPPKDLIHRIYRDVRFSSDKTPYKRHFSMSISRSGRKGIWAGYFACIQPRNKSILAAGVWGPGKNELASIRRSILNDPEPLRQILSKPSFCEQFGKYDPKAKARANVFGHDDALKVAPKDIAKDHKDIDLLKLRSVAVVHTFPDEVVLRPDFMQHLMGVVHEALPLVHHMNSVLTLPAD